jgi:hypothetical protein
MARGDFGTMLIGYARMSPTDQNPELQIDPLLNAGVIADTSMKTA